MRCSDHIVSNSIRTPHRSKQWNCKMRDSLSRCNQMPQTGSGLFHSCSIFSDCRLCSRRCTAHITGCLFTKRLTFPMDRICLSGFLFPLFRLVRSNLTLFFRNLYYIFTYLHIDNTAIILYSISQHQKMEVFYNTWITTVSYTHLTLPTT